ncbi:hypothetical protein RJI07_00120 [Mycoplasmatota bacterium WC30]
MISERYLDKLETAMALKQGRKPCEILLVDLPETYCNVLSMFEREGNLIIFNKDIIDQVSELEVIASMIHEGRHAYQWYQVSNPNKSEENQETLNLWKKEFSLYSQPLNNENNLEYASQSIEIDAVAYTSLEIENISEGELIIPKEILNIVNERKEVLKLRNIM